jgi:hypothetical protein
MSKERHDDPGKTAAQLREDLEYVERKAEQNQGTMTRALWRLWRRVWRAQ